MKNLQLLLIFLLFLFRNILYAQWTQTNGPGGGGYINAIAVDNQNIFVGTSGGIFRSTNNGASWTGSVSVDIQALAINGTNIFAGTYGEIYLSTNNGSSWTSVNNGVYGAISFAFNGINIYAGCLFGDVILSTNNGANWTSIKSNLSAGDVLALATSGENIFAGTIGGVYLSTNNGGTWTDINTGLNDFAVVTSLAIINNNLFAGTNEGIFFSTNSGTTWNKINSTFEHGFVKSLAVSAENLYAGVQNYGVFLSTDNGISWKALNIGLTDSTRLEALAANGNNIFAGTQDSKLFHSTNSGMSWNVSNYGFPASKVYSLFATGDKIFAGTSLGGVYISEDNGYNWTSINSGLPIGQFYYFSIIDTNIFVGTDDGVYRLDNNSTSWSDASSGMLNRKILSLTASGQNLFAGKGGGDLSGSGAYLSGGGAYLSTNYGMSWFDISSDLPLSPPPFSNYPFFNDVFIIGTNIVAGTEQGIYLSTNNGQNWKSGTGINNAVECLDTLGSNLFAGAFSQVYISRDSGWTWTAVDSGFRNSQSTIKVLKAIGNNLLAVTYGFNQTIYLSTNNGVSWRDVGSGLPAISIWSVAVNDSFIFAGTQGCGVYRRYLSEMITTNIKNEYMLLPEKIILYQNYPNPFNSTTFISFTLPLKSFVSIRMFDILGNEVALIVNKELFAGNHTERWNAIGLPSGVYFCQLQAGSFTETKKFVLLK